MNFDYNDIKIEGCSFKISPSSISKFFDYPSIWYKENILGEKEFHGNTATELGTVCHAIYEAVGLGETTNRDAINKYLMSEEVTSNPEVDVDTINELYPLIAAATVNEYLLSNLPDKVEQQVYTAVLDDIYVGGTYDALKGSCVVDYKTVSKKPSDSIPFGYKIQMLAYAYALRANNVFVDRIRLVYGVRPTKTLPARCFVVTEQIGFEDWKMIEDTLKLIALTVQKAKEQPELVPLLFKSMNLQET